MMQLLVFSMAPRPPRSAGAIQQRWWVVPAAHDLRSRGQPPKLQKEGTTPRTFLETRAFPSHFTRVCLILEISKIPFANSLLPLKEA